MTVFHILWKADDHDVSCVITDVEIDDDIVDPAELSPNDWVARAMIADKWNDDDAERVLSKGYELFAVIEGPAKFY